LSVVDLGIERNSFLDQASDARVAVGEMGYGGS
jgi:hypothetical protein